MPTAVTNCLKPKFMLVTSSAAIATITQLQGRTRHLKISNIRQVRLLKIIWQKLAIFTTEDYKVDFLQQCIGIQFNVKSVVV